MKLGRLLFICASLLIIGFAAMLVYDSFPSVPDAKPGETLLTVTCESNKVYRLGEGAKKAKTMLVTWRTSDGGTRTDTIVEKR